MDKLTNEMIKDLAIRLPIGLRLGSNRVTMPIHDY